MWHYWGLALMAVLLTGCLDSAGSGGGGTNARAAPTARLMSGRITVAGPRGFCIDPGATRDTADSGFVAMGSCAVISGYPRDSKPRKPALLTASVASAGQHFDTDALDRMAAFFSTAAGQAALARGDGAGEAVTVIDLSRQDETVLAHVSDGHNAGNLSGDYWRAVFETAGQLVTVTVSGYRETPLDDKAGADLTRSFIAAIRRANPRPKREASASPQGGGAGLASFFNRLP